MTTVLASMFAMFWRETWGYCGISDGTLEAMLGLSITLSCVYVILWFFLAARKASRTLGDRLTNTRVIDVRSEAARAIHGTW